MSSPFFWVIENVFTVYEHLDSIYQYLQSWDKPGTSRQLLVIEQHVQNIFIDMFSINTTVRNMDN